MMGENSLQSPLTPHCIPHLSIPSPPPQLPPSILLSPIYLSLHLSPIPLHSLPIPHPSISLSLHPVGVHLVSPPGIKSGSTAAVNLFSLNSLFFLFKHAGVFVSVDVVGSPPTLRPPLECCSCCWLAPCSPPLLCLGSTPLYC